MQLHPELLQGLKSHNLSGLLFQFFIIFTVLFFFPEPLLIQLMTVVCSPTKHLSTEGGSAFLVTSSQVLRSHP